MCGRKMFLLVISVGLRCENNVVHQLGIEVGEVVDGDGIVGEGGDGEGGGRHRLVSTTNRIGY